MPSRRPAAVPKPLPKPLPEGVAHAVELLSPLGSVRTRRMFGGWGLYVDELFIALIAFERLYLKAGVDDEAAFRAAGGEPFVYDGGSAGKAVTLRYWTPPAEALDSPALMQPWARRAMAAALAARLSAPGAAKAPGRRAASGRSGGPR